MRASEPGRLCYTIPMSWAAKRKLIYIGSIVTIFLLIVIPFAYIKFYKAPTCFDGKQNQTEVGVDCGGPCTLLCRAQYAPLTVVWSRFSKVTDGIYNVMAYIENPNLNAGANNLSYVFKLYDKDGLLLRERTGKTFAPANRVMAVFEPDLWTGNQIPQRVEFTFSSEAVWLRQNSSESNLSVSQAELSRLDSAPRLSAELQNKSINIIKQIEAIAVVYNAEGNTFAFSRTIIDNLVGKEVRPLTFNWPKPFDGTSARTEIILKVLK